MSIVNFEQAKISWVCPTGIGCSFYQTFGGDDLSSTDFASEESQEPERHYCWTDRYGGVVSMPGKTEAGNQIDGTRISGQNGLIARCCMDYCYEEKCKAISW